MDTYNHAHKEVLRALIGKYFQGQDRETAEQHIYAHDFASAEMCIVATAERLMNKGELSATDGQEILNAVVIPKRDIVRIRAQATRLY